ncbi:MAG: Dickkopf N-terminal cysteine-rich domain-containing protein [Nannocystaceae bacterium]
MRHLLSARVAARLLAAALVLPACNNEIPYEDVDDEQVDAICDYLVGCGIAASTELCVDAYRGVLDNDPNLDAAVDNGSVVYDGEAAKQCLDSIRESTCSGDIFGADADTDACDQVFTGTVDNGGACWFSEQCVSGSCDLGDCVEACCEGTCIATPPDVGVGEDCTGAANCVSGSYCDFNSGLCAAAIGDGGTCGSDYECATDLYCLGGVCKASLPEGASCIEGECGAFLLGCDVDTDTCQKFRKEGEACNPLASLCAFGLRCDEVTSKCAPPGGVGTPCGFSGTSCANGTFCDFEVGTCQATKASGAACVLDSECQSLYCDDTCKAEPICVQ